MVFFLLFFLAGIPRECFHETVLHMSGAKRGTPIVPVIDEMKLIAEKDGAVATPEDEDINETDDDQAHDDEPRPVPVVIPPQPINLLDEVELQVPAAKVPKVSVRPPAVLPVEPIHPPLPQPKAPPPKLTKKELQIAKDKIGNQSMDKFVKKTAVAAVVPPPKSAFVAQRTLPPPLEEDEFGFGIVTRPF